MEYSKFKQLIQAGEKSYVDFKIRCDAFVGKETFQTAELAKDVCAMANNGNVTCYIIIGVSDDGNQFVSVENKNLTDEKLQDYCKDAISPPPRVHLERISWKKGDAGVINKEFVIIRIGPNVRTAFRIRRDLINQPGKYFYRHNEVWIRRGSTSDIATPEEVARLVQGNPVHEDIDSANNLLQASRNFTQYSRLQQIDLITKTSTNILIKNYKYRNIVLYKSRYTFDGGYFKINQDIFYKNIGDELQVFLIKECKENLTLNNLKFLEHFDLVQKNIRSRNFNNLLGEVSTIHKIMVIPVFGKVNPEKIQSIHRSWKRSGNFYHFIETSNIKRRSPDDLRDKEVLEYIFIDKIKSDLQYQITLSKVIEEIENPKNLFFWVPKTIVLE